MHDFRIYYDGGLTYEGAPENAPAFGVLVIVEKDQNSGRRLVMTKDYFCWLGDRWLSTDFIGMLDYLQQPGWKRVLFGRLVDDEYWYSVVKRANEDPDFPARTSYGYNERVV